MQTSAEGRQLIKDFEGFSSKPYLCPAGVWTIGYGSTFDVDANTKPVTKGEADRMLIRDLRVFEDAINRLVKVTLTQNQFDALVSFTYNVGQGALSRSTLLKRINANQFDDVPAQFMRWNRAKGQVMHGLTRRRQAEAALWMREAVIVDAAEMPQAVDAPDKPLAKSRTVANAGLAGAVGTAMVAAPVIEPAGQVVRIAQENPQGLMLVIGIAMIAFAAIAIYLRLDDRKKAGL